jgi:effector-binding domain-containing protein
MRNWQMDYVVATHELAQRPVISIRDRHPQAELPGFIGDAFGALFGRLGLLGVKPAGHPFVIYHAFDPEEIDAEVCLPVAPDITGSGRTQTRTLPSMTVARTLHVGPYEDLGDAYAVLTEWVRHNKFETAGPVQERYLNGPGDHVPPAEYRTEIEIPIVPAAVPVG